MSVQYVFVCSQVASRVAEERGAFLGHEVGYTIRFDDCSDPHATRIKVQTHARLLVLRYVVFKEYPSLTSCYLCLSVSDRWDVGSGDDV